MTTQMIDDGVKTARWLADECNFAPCATRRFETVAAALHLAGLVWSGMERHGESKEEKDVLQEVDHH
jgi:hypothetical protein